MVFLCTAVSFVGVLSVFCCFVLLTGMCAFVVYYVFCCLVCWLVWVLARLW